MNPVQRIALLLVAAGANPAFAAAEKPAATPEVKMVPAGQVRGKLTKPPGDTLTLSVPYGNNKWQDVDFPVGGEIQVRVMTPPSAFDIKGNFKTYSQKELQEMKGPNKRLPGYTGAMDDLKAGAVVDVYLVKKPGAPRVGPGKEIPPEYKPQVSMVVVYNTPK